MTGYDFTNDWFEQTAKATWDDLFSKFIKPKKILEIGSFEGKSVCYLIEKLGRESDLEIHAIDTWAGGYDINDALARAEIQMSDVEARFHKNVKLAAESVPNQIQIHVHKGCSDREMAKLLVIGHEFDFIYVDGSHETFDTLVDLVFAFKLLKVGGLLAVDDYLWQNEDKPYCKPKFAIDAFVNLALHKITLVRANNSQVYFLKDKK